MFFFCTCCYLYCDSDCINCIEPTTNYTFIWDLFDLRTPEGCRTKFVEKNDMGELDTKYFALNQDLTLIFHLI